MNKPGGERTMGQISQGANEPGGEQARGEPAKGRKSHNSAIGRDDGKRRMCRSADVAMGRELSQLTR